VTEEAAGEGWQMVKATFTQTSGALPKKDRFRSLVRVLPTASNLPTDLATTLEVGGGGVRKGGAPWMFAGHGAARGNATVLLMDLGWLDCREKVAMDVLYKVVPNMFFQQLRTKQQTGYVASTSLSELERRTLAIFVVESSWCGPGDLLARFERFIEAVDASWDAKPHASSEKAALQRAIKGGAADAKGKEEEFGSKPVLNQKSFEMVRDAMLADYKKPIQTIAEMGSALQNIVMSYDGDFSVMLKRRSILRTLTLGEVKAVAQKVYNLRNQRRLASLYTPKDVPTDLHLAPATYRLMKETELHPSKMTASASSAEYGEFVPKPKYHCNVPITESGTRSGQEGEELGEGVDVGVGGGDADVVDVGLDDGDLALEDLGEVGRGHSPR